MKYLEKIFTFVIIIFLLLSNFQVGVLYADNLNELEVQKGKSIAALEKVEQVIDVAVEKIDASLDSEVQKNRLEEKNEEIKDYIDIVENQIESENSTGDVKEIIAEAKRVIVLKVVAGVTKQQDVGESLPAEIANNKEKKEEALEVIQESLEGVKGGDYNLIIQSKINIDKIKQLFGKFDSNIGLELMYENEGKSTYQVSIPNDSLFKQEMLEDIESGIMPESFLGIEIVQPEVFSIFSDQIDLSGENISETWGVSHYNTPSYLSLLEEESNKSGFKKIKVGIIDTGIDYNHPDLKGRVLSGKDFVNKDDDAIDDQGHGTHVSGTIGASINGSGIIGINPYVEFVPIKICTNRGFCPSYAVLKALEYTKNEKLDVLNMSLGGRGDPKTNPICSGIASNIDAGVIVISASGNSNIDTSKFVPGGCEKAISVAAVDKNLERAGFSNFGTDVDVSAPGVKVYSTLPNNRYRELSGTSMATPHIVGLVSIMKTFNSNLNQESARKLLQKYPLSVSTDGGKYIASAVDVDALMNALVEPTTEQNEVLKEVVDGGKIRYIRDWANGSNKNKNSHWVEIEAIEKTTNKNVALNKSIKSKNNNEYASRPYSRATDGNFASGQYAEGLSGSQYLEVDLGKGYDISTVKIIHYYADGRTYNDTKTEVSADGINWRVLFDSVKDGTYAEPRDGSGKTHIVEIVEEKTPAKTQIQYIRDWSNGSDKNGGNHWVEIKAIDKPTGLNVATKGSVTTNNPVEDMGKPYKNLINGSINTANYASGGGGHRYMQVNLGQKYDISEIKILHYYKDNRTYKNTRTEVSEDGIIWATLYDSAKDGTYIEPVDGSGKTHLVDLSKLKFIESNTSTTGKVRYIRDWVHGSNVSSSNVWTEIQALDQYGVNKALKAKASTDYTLGGATGKWEYVTDGATTGYWFGKTNINSYNHVKVDLGEVYDIAEVKIWHYQDGRTFKKTKTEISVDGINWNVLFDSKVDGTYPEVKGGNGRAHNVDGKEKKSSTVDMDLKDGGIRYIRDWANGSNRNKNSHWVEIQAIGKTTGLNIARGKKVTSKNNNEYETRPYSRTTDGILAGGLYAEGLSGSQYLQVDLGGNYNLSEVNIWHYYPDGGTGRIYKDTKTEVSADGVNWTVLFDSAISGTYVEPKDGSGRSYKIVEEKVVDKKVIEEKVVTEKEAENTAIKKDDVKEEVEEKSSEYKILLKGMIDSKKIDFINNQKEQDNKINISNKNLEKEALEKIANSVDLENVAIEINAFESDGVEINSSDYIFDGTGSIDMQIVKPIQSGEFIGDRSYDENGKLLDETRINSSGEDLEAIEGKRLPENFTDSDLYNFGEVDQDSEVESHTEGVKISNVDEEEEFIEGEEIFLDGANHGVKINSIGEEELKNLKFSEYSTGALEGENNITVIGDNGEEIILTQEDFIESKSIIEELGDIKHTDELIIDGAEKGVEINSIGDKQEGDSLEFIDGDNLEPSLLHEVGNPGEAENINSDELVSSDVVDSLPEDFILETEFFVEGAKKPEGVEINSFADEEPSDEERMIIPDFSEETLDVLTGSVLGDETIVDITDEDAKFLEEKLSGLDEDVEVVTEIEEFDDTELKASLDGEKNSGIEINNIDEEDIFTIELTDEEEAELDELYSDSELVEGTIGLDSEIFDETSIIDQEEEGNGIEINSFSEEESENEFIEEELTSQQKEELEKAFPSTEQDGIEVVEFDEWSDDYNADTTESSDSTISELDNINHGGIEINSFGDDEATEIANVEETEGDLEKIIIDEEKIKAQAEEIYISDADITEHELGLSAEELGDDRGEDEIIFDEPVVLDNIEGAEVSEEEGSSIGIQNTYYCDVYVGEYCNYRFYKSRRYKKVNPNSSISYVGASKRYIYVYGKKIGKNKITWYDSRNKSAVTVHVNVKPFPKPFYKTYYLTKGKDFTLNLSNANRYSYSYSTGGRNIISAYAGSNSITLKNHNTGVAWIHIRTNGRHVGTIRAIVNVPRYYVTIKSGENYVHNLSWANGHKYTTSNSKIANVAVGRSHFSVIGKTTGTTYIAVRDYRGNHKFNLTVIVTPPPMVTKTIIAGQVYTHSVKRPASYKYSFSNSKLADLRTGSKYNYYLYTKSAGTLYTKVVDRRDRHQYTLKLIIKPVPIVSASTYAGETYIKPLTNARSHKYAVSDSNIAYVRSDRSQFRVITKKAGVVYTTVNNYLGYPQYILKLTVKNPPKPKEYTINIGEKKRLNFYFANKQDYRIYRTSSNGGNAHARNKNGYIQLYGQIYGKAQYKIYGKYHLYTLNVNIIPKVETVNVDIYNTKKVCHYTGRNTDFTTKNGSNIAVSRYSKGLCFEGKKAGKTSVYVKDRGFNIKTFNINIKAIPVPKTYHVTVGDGKYTNLYVPTQNGQIYYFSQASKGGYVGAWQYGNRVSIKGSKHGKTTLKVYDRTHGLHYYTIEINIAPKPPIVIAKEVYETKSIWISHKYVSSGNTSQSNSGISYSKNYRGIRAYGEKAGTTNLYIKDSTGAVTHIYKIKVIKKPDAKIYNHTITAGYSKNIVLPEDIESYKVFTTNGGLLYKNELPYSRNVVNIKAHRVGEMKVHVQQYVGGHYWEKYTINISIVPTYKNYTLTVGDRISTWYNDNYSFDAGGVATLHHGKNSGTKMVGVKSGKATWYIYKYERSGKVLRTVYNITVKPQPKIINQTCTTTVGNTCSLFTPNSGHKYSTDVSLGYYDIDSYKDRLKVSSDRTGTFTFYLQAEHGNYYTHKFTTNFTPKAAKVVECEIMVGGICDLGSLRSINRGHEFTYTKAGLTSVNYARKTYSQKDLTKNREDSSGNDYRNVDDYQRYLINYSIEGEKAGKTSIYMYDEGDHLLTINVTIHPKVEFKFEDRTLSTFQLKRVSTKILSGGGDYNHIKTLKTNGDDSIYKLDYLYVDSDKDKTGKYLPTGEVKLEEEEAGNYNVEITDKFGQRKDISLTVKDTVLMLSDYEVNMSGYDSFLVHIRQSYGDIKVPNMNDDKVSANLVELSDGSQAIEIKMKKPGRSIITVVDENPHFTQPTDGSKPQSKAIRTISVFSHERYKEIEVDEVIEEEVAELTGVRYIRDWLHGSNLTTTNVWTEIQALDASGNNKALGATVTTDYTLAPTGIPANVTDGKTSGNRFGKSSANSYNNVTVDLGDNFDIQTVKVWHYNDGRIMNKTKTEVSADGVNWTVLFDSAVSGRYVEPKDGSGRSYEVKGVKNNEIISIEGELERELNKSLAEFGINYLEISNVNETIKINSAENSYRCENARTGEYYIRPYNALCEDNKYGKAWTCDLGYVDLGFGKYGNVNTCIKKGEVEKVIIYKGTVDKFREVISRIPQNKVEKIINKINSKRESFSKKEVLIYIVDDILNQLDKKLDNGYKEEQDVISFWQELKIIANDGKYWWGDGYITYDNLKGKSRGEIEQYALNFSKKLFNYKLKYEPAFKQGYEKELARQQAKGVNTKTFGEGAVVGPIIATKDYIIGYTDILPNLETLSLDSLSNGLDNIWGTITSPEKILTKAEERVTQEAEKLKELGEIVINIDGIVLPQGDYDRGHDTLYAVTSLGLEAIPDPAKKVMMILGGGKTPEAYAKIQKLNKDKKEKDKKEEEAGYVKENRSPKVYETFLRIGYTRTGKKYNGAEVFKDKKGKYYYIDTFHKGKGSHIEVFNKTGTDHLGEAHPITGVINYSKSDPKKKIPNYLK